MNLSANAIGSNGAAAGADTAGNAGNDGILYSAPLEVVTIPSPYVATGGNGSGGGADAGNLGGSAGGSGGDGVNFSGQNGTALTAGNYTGLVNNSVVTGGNGGNGSASGTATGGLLSGGTGGYGGNGVTAFANFSEISGTGKVTGGKGGAGGNGGTAGDTGGNGGFGGDGIDIVNNNTQLNSMGAIAGGIGGAGGVGDGALSGDGGYGGLGILVAATSATLTVNSNVTGGLGGNGGAAGGAAGQAGTAGDGGYGIDIDALGTGANVTIGTGVTVLGGSIGVNGAKGSGSAAVGGAVDGVGIGVEGTGGTITNKGTVEGGSAGAGVAIGIAASTTQLTNTGHITATTGDSVRVEDYFNYGTVMLSTLNNTGGTISATTGNAVNIAGDLGGSHIGTLTNTGTISATSGNAIFIDNAGGGGATIGTLTNTGTISATSGVALNIANGGDLTTLNNTGGTITSADAVGAGAPNNATVVLDSTSQTALTLNGAISNTAANNAAEALSIQATSGATITTAGTIRADGAGGVNSGAGVAIEFDAAATVNNTGTIYGQIIDTGNNAATLTNSGAMHGAIALGSADTFNNSGTSTLSGASTVGTLSNTGTITINSGKTFTTTEASGGGTYTFQLTPGSTTSNGTEGQLISGTTNLTGATIAVAPGAGSFVNNSLFEIVAGTGAVTGVTATPTDVGAAHGDTATYKFYDVLGGTTLSSAFGGITVPGNADDVFIIAVKQGAITYLPPVAHADSFAGTENTAIAGNVLLNDTDPNGLALSVTAATLATAHGTVVENATGAITYTPAANFVGTDTFHYTVKDTAGLSSTGAVNVTVSASSPTAPVAHTDNFTSSENDPMFGNVLVNNGNGPDTDPNGIWLSTAAATLTTAHGASVTEASDGTITYIPAANFVGTDTFNYTLQDGAGYTSTGTVNVTVGPLSTTGVVTFGPGSNMLFGGDGGPGGSDTYVFKAANLGTGVDTIRDFSLGDNDKIDIADVLSGHYNPATQALSNFVNIVTSGSDSIVEVDVTGHAGASGWSQVATLFSVTGLNEQSLVQQGNLIV